MKFLKKCILYLQHVNLNDKGILSCVWSIFSCLQKAQRPIWVLITISLLLAVQFLFFCAKCGYFDFSGKCVTTAHQQTGTGLHLFSVFLPSQHSKRFTTFPHSCKHSHNPDGRGCRASRNWGCSILLTLNWSLEKSGIESFQLPEGHSTSIAMRYSSCDVNRVFSRVNK